MNHYQHDRLLIFSFRIESSICNNIPPTQSSTPTLNSLPNKAHFFIFIPKIPDLRHQRPALQPPSNSHPDGTTAAPNFGTSPRPASIEGGSRVTGPRAASRRSYLVAGVTCHGLARRLHDDRRGTPSSTDTENRRRRDDGDARGRCARTRTSAFPSRTHTHTHDGAGKFFGTEKARPEEVRVADGGETLPRGSQSGR